MWRTEKGNKRSSSKQVGVIRNFLLTTSGGGYRSTSHLTSRNEAVVDGGKPTQNTPLLNRSEHRARRVKSPGQAEECDTGIAQIL